MANGRRKRRFKVRYVVLGILVLILVAVGTVTVTNWDNIQAGYAGLTSDPEEIQAKQEEKKSQLEQDLGVSGGFTEEEMSAAQEAIASILPDDLAEFVSGSNVTEALNNGGSETGTAAGTSTEGSSSSVGSASSGGTGGSSSSGTTSSGSTGAISVSSSGGDSSAGGSNSNSIENNSSGSNSVDAITRKYTSQLYALEGTLNGKINSIVSSAKAEYAALPASDRNSSSKASIVSSKIDEAAALEDSCDAAVDTILSNMQSELKAAGGDTSAVSQLREYYESEKASKKAAAIAAMRAG